MKAIKVIISVILYALMAYNVFANEKTYCDGWREGYREGFCYEIVNCIKPVTPVCPIPKINFNKYKDGYNRGFKQALKDRKNEGN